MSSLFGNSFSGSNTGDLFGFATAGMFAGTMEAKSAQQQAAALAKQQQDAANARQARINAQIQAVDESYGIGNNQNAQNNAKQLNDYLDKAGNAYQEGNLFNLNDQFGNSLRQSKFNLARTGNLGGQEDANTQVNALGALEQGRNQVATDTANYKANIQNQLQNQRSQTEQEISSGLTVDTSNLLNLAGQKAAIDQAGANIPASTYGNLFAQAGANYGQARIAGAYGYGPMAASSPYPYNPAAVNGMPMMAGAGQRPSGSAGASGGFS